MLPSPSPLRRAVVLGFAWLLSWTLINASREQAVRSTLIFAAPVVWVAWHDVRAAFVMAGIGTLSALAGGAIPHPGSREPAFIEGLFAYYKLSILAVCTVLVRRHVRRE
ncbi:hypothetical protein [Azohydromonas australica]|uniref:hypothetical protein n=1 Tax=Azohydromonas australica TaxID=364039 RepID=UPI00041F4B3E|nr:hypothetical protein [Azohydromonas australica]